MVAWKRPCLVACTMIPVCLQGTLDQARAQALLYEIRGSTSLPIGREWISVSDMTGDSVPDFFAFSDSRVDLFSGANGKHVRKVADLKPGWASVDAGRDVNGDKVSDFICGWPKLGRVELRSGKNGSILKTWTSSVPKEGFGISVGFVGDLTGDKRSDVFLVSKGLPYPIHPSPIPPSLQVLDSGTGNLVRKTLLPKNIDYVAARPGFDLDGNGTEEIVLSTRNVSGWSTRWGTVIFSYPEIRVWDLSTFKVSVYMYGRSGSRLVPPYLFAEVGDLDADKAADLLLGIEGQNKVDVISGKTKRVLYSHRLSSFDFGRRPLGDLDGDGIPDYSIEDKSKSEVVVFHGANHKELWAHRYSIAAKNKFHLGLEDLDLDSIPEIAIGDSSSLRVYRYNPSRWEAGYASLLEPSGPKGLGKGYLTGTGKPIVGKSLALTCDAPNYNFAVFLIGMKPHLGDMAPIPGNPLLLYLDKQYLLPWTFSSSMVNGKAQLALSLPHVESLIPIQFGIQAALFSLQGSGKTGASNLLLVKPGLDYPSGRSFFSIGFRFAIGAQSNYKDRLGNPVPFYRNSDVAKSVIFKGSKGAGVGPLEFRTGPGSPPIGGGFLLGSVPIAGTRFSVKVWVPPGKGTPVHVYLRNADGKNMMSVSLEAISVLD